MFFVAATCSRAQSSDSAALPTAPAPPQTKTSVAHYGELPLAFEPNRGQSGDPVRFLSHSTGELLLLEQNQAVLRVAANPRSKEKNSASGRSDELKIRFANANPGAEIVPLDVQPGKSNYFLGNDP